MMKKNKRIALMLSGALLMCSAVGLTAYNIHEDFNASSAASSVLKELDDAMKSGTGNGLPAGISGEMDGTISPDTPMPTITIKGKEYIGTIKIPTLSLELPVAKDWDYTQMKTSPCRYSGSAYSNDLVICAHNFSTHFRNIRNLHPDDTVIFTDAVGNEFYYGVDKVETLAPTAVSEMLSPDYDLSLFTCTYGGSARVTVRCRISG